MRKILFLCFTICSLFASAQKKAPSVSLHYGFTDFKTAMNMKAASFGSVLKNGQWSKFPEMDAGYGFSYWQGLHPNIDVSAGVNFSKSIYTFPSGASTTEKNIFTADAKGIFKIFAEDKASVTPYLSAGVGLYNNAGKTGLYAPIGLGVHANLWNEAFVFAGADYRITFKNTDNKSFLYAVGVGTHLFRKKEKPTPVTPPPVIVPEVKPITKNVAVWVKDEATGLPLPGVEVKLTDANGKTYSAISDEDGKLNIENVLQADYNVSGILNGIATQSKQLQTAMFDGNDATINLVLLHNDPRFTLVGKAVDKKSNTPVGNVTVSINNTTNNTLDTTSSNADDGKFKVQLVAASDFSISGKKAGYFSNIEQVSTKGLNRSTTLYVKLELDIQQAKQGGQFVLNKIYFETNKADLNTAASTDLNRLVKYLQDNPTASLEIQGHTDNRGNDALNNRLSQSRAVSVLNYLVSQGISPTRLTAKGYGSKNPIDTNATAEGRANNRRVEVKILGE